MVLFRNSVRKKVRRSIIACEAIWQNYTAITVFWPKTVPFLMQKCARNFFRTHFEFRPPLEGRALFSYYFLFSCSGFAIRLPPAAFSAMKADLQSATPNFRITNPKERSLRLGLKLLVRASGSYLRYLIQYSWIRAGGSHQH